MSAIMGHCRHYSYDTRRAPGGARCAVGCDLTKPGAIRACLPNLKDSPCSKREEYTSEERDAAVERSNQSVERFAAALQAISEARPQPGQTGEVTCPICKARLKWACAKGNGHLHAACETDGCVRFMS